MASEPREIFTYKASVLWLWHAHNRVNFRLKGDDTEDKQFPKILFPSHKVIAAVVVSAVTVAGIVGGYGYCLGATALV